MLLFTVFNYENVQYDTQKKQTLGNFVIHKFILGKEARPPFPFCLSPLEVLRVSERVWFCTAALYTGVPALAARLPS